MNWILPFFMKPLTAPSGLLVLMGQSYEVSSCFTEFPQELIVTWIHRTSLPGHQSRDASLDHDVLLVKKFVLAY